MFELLAVGENLFAVLTKGFCSSFQEGRGQCRHMIDMERGMPRIDDGFIELLTDFLRGKHDGAVRTVQRIIRGERDDIGERHGGRKEVGRDEADALPDVHPKVCADFSRNLREAAVICIARVADGREDDQMRFCLVRRLLDLIPVENLFFCVYAEVFECEAEAAAMFCFAQIERKYAAVWLQQ